jgi:hypothetical protein
MRPFAFSLPFFLFLCFFSRAWADPAPPREKGSWGPVEKILGHQGLREGDMLKLAFVRTDLNVTIDGVPLEPRLGLVDWIAFKPVGKKNLVRGKLVLTDQEIPQALVLLGQKGFQVTSIHNRFLDESPSLKEVSIKALGRGPALAEGFKAVLKTAGEFEGPFPAAVSEGTGSATPVLTPVPSKPGKVFLKVEELLGPGKLDGKILEYEFPGAGKVSEDGEEIPPFMGLATTFRFEEVRGQSIGTESLLGFYTGGGNSTNELTGVAGNFALRADELNPVMEILSRYQIIPTSVYDPFRGEAPRIFFLNFWGLGVPGEVAKGLKEALDKTRPREEP